VSTGYPKQSRRQQRENKGNFNPRGEGAQIVMENIHGILLPQRSMDGKTSALKSIRRMPKVTAASPNQGPFVRFKEDEIHRGEIELVLFIVGQKKRGVRWSMVKLRCLKP